MRLGRFAIGPREDADLAGEVGDVLGFVVVAGLRVAVVLDVLDDLDLTRRQTNLLSLLLIVDGPPAQSVGVPLSSPFILVVRFDVLVDRVLSLRTHDLFAVQVVSDVVVLVVPFHRDVTNGIARLLHVTIPPECHFIV